MNKSQKEESVFIFLAECLWLDFVNTESVSQGQRVELVPDARSLSQWIAQTGIVSSARQAEENWTQEAIEQVHSFRAALRDLAACLAQKLEAPEAAVNAINTVLALRIGFPQIVRLKESLHQQFYWELKEPLALFAAVAEDAARSLCDADTFLIKKCENPVCIRYFCDTTKNHARRWCSMSGCGNRMKVAAHYQRARQNLKLN